MNFNIKITKGETPMKNNITSFLLMLMVLALTACTSDQKPSVKPEQEAKKDKYTTLAEEANNEDPLEKLELLPYAEEVEATLSSPKYKEFVANSTVLIKGKAKKYNSFKSDHVWIKVRSSEEGPNGWDFSYYAPLKEGKFEQKIQLFNGKGNYSVKVSVPSDTAEDYYYDIASFDVENVNPEIKRDIAYTKNAFQYDLKLKNSINGYMERDGSFELTGEVADSNVEQLMVELKKESESTKIMVPVENGEFTQKIPLYYGAGVHEVQIMTPKEGSTDFFTDAAHLCEEFI
jgi:hypothetical protein